MMKKWVIVMFVLLVLFVAGCSNAKDNGSTTDNNLQKINSNEKVAQTDNSAGNDLQDSALDKQNSKQMKLAKTCDFLTVSDIKDVCGSDVNMTKDPDYMGPCSLRFTNSADHTFRLIYYEYPPTDSKERSYNYCIRPDGGGEETQEFICVTPEDENVYVFGDYYSITLGMDYKYPNDNVCNFEQTKELGKLVKQRIYG